MRAASFSSNTMTGRLLVYMPRTFVSPLYILQAGCSIEERIFRSTENGSTRDRAGVIHVFECDSMISRPIFEKDNSDRRSLWNV
jgi:hypothetical protein